MQPNVVKIVHNSF